MRGLAILSLALLGVTACGGTTGSVSTAARYLGFTSAR